MPAAVPEHSVVERISVSLNEAAYLLGVHRNTVRNKIQQGEIPVIRVGRRVLIRLLSLYDWAVANEAKLSADGGAQSAI